MASIRRSAMAVLLAILLSGCAGGKAAQSARETRYFRLASSQSENYVTNQACLRFCDAVRKRSGGSIIIEPYFDSTLGQDTQALEQCCFGGVDFARVSATSAAQYAPQLTALQMPYEYTSDKHLFRVLDGKIGRSALDSLEASGLTGITYFYAGYRCFFSAEEVLGSVESMRGLRLRVDESPVMTGLVGLWGHRRCRLQKRIWPPRCAAAKWTRRRAICQPTWTAATIGLRLTGCMTGMPITRMCSWPPPKPWGF